MRFFVLFFSAALSTMAAVPAHAQGDTGKKLSAVGLKSAISDCTNNRKPISCVVVSNHYRAIAPDGANDAKSRQYLKIGCNNAAANGSDTNEKRVAGRGTCLRAGNVFFNGTGGPVDYKAAFLHHGRACDFGEMVGCAYNAESLQQGRGVEKNKGAAISLYRKACSEKLPVACYQPARMLFFDAMRRPADVSTNPDFVFGRKAARIACESEWSARGVSCWYHGLYLEGGWGGSKDQRGGIAALEQACTLKQIPEHCTSLAVSLNRGPADLRDPARVRSLLDSACRAKYDYACKQLERL